MAGPISDTAVAAITFARAGSGEVEHDAALRLNARMLVRD